LAPSGLSAPTVTFFVMPEGPDYDTIGAEIDAATAK
jgi:hypothetical protein